VKVQSILSVIEIYQQTTLGLRGSALALGRYDFLPVVFVKHLVREVILNELRTGTYVKTKSDPILNRVSWWLGRPHGNRETPESNSVAATCKLPKIIADLVRFGCPIQGIEVKAGWPVARCAYNCCCADQLLNI
jgi:hypothetical protein